MKYFTQTLFDSLTFHLNTTWEGLNLLKDSSAACAYKSAMGKINLNQTSVDFWTTVFHVSVCTSIYKNSIH